MTLREQRRATLHGPWETADEAALRDLRREFGDEWRAWRAMSDRSEMTEWCARRVHTRPGGTNDLTAPTAAQLRGLLEAER